MASTFDRVMGVVGGLLGQPIRLDKPGRNDKPKPWRGARYPIPGKLWTAEFIASKDFLKTWEWRSVAYDAIKRRGRKCDMCFRTPQKHGVAINVDHVQPRLSRPDLALSPSNLQILCDEHNHGKGNRDSTDWR